jgi:hypothetical protein
LISGLDPEAVNEVSAPKPKKDHGQSPLQVALKTGRLEIADCLMDHGADVNFMEAQDEDPGLRAPVLFDAITCVIDSLCYEAFDISRKAVPCLERMLKEGADANKKASNGMSPIGWTVWRAKYIICSPHNYPNSQEMARKQTARILDLLQEYGADFKARADDKEGRSSTNRGYYLDDFRPKDENHTADNIKDLQVFLQNYVRSRNIKI